MERPVGDLVSQWQSYLANVGTNLMELSEQTEFLLIKAKTEDNANGYTGITKIKADNCVKAVGNLWGQFNSLTEVVEKANSLKAKRSFLFNEEEAVRELLENTLIVVESEHIDINDRNLLSGESQEIKAKPRELLKHMQENFERLCRDIKEISDAEESLQRRLEAIKEEIAKLNSTVKRLGIDNIPEFDTHKVAAVENDPLQGIQEVDKLVYSVEKYRASIKIIEDEYEDIENIFHKVRNMLSELVDLTSRSKLAASESRRIFGESVASKPVISEEVIKSLYEWLKVLESKLCGGHLSAVKIGASKLEKECSLKLECERKNYEAIGRDYNEWLDLKGQFKALLVKAEVLKAKGLLVEDSLEELINDTNAVLYAVPVDLENCREMVRRFEMNL